MGRSKIRKYIRHHKGKKEIAAFQYKVPLQQNRLLIFGRNLMYSKFSLNNQWVGK